MVFRALGCMSVRAIHSHEILKQARTANSKQFPGAVLFSCVRWEDLAACASFVSFLFRIAPDTLYCTYQERVPTVLVRGKRLHADIG